MKEIRIIDENSWIGFDLDGTIAEFDQTEWENDMNWIGKPISKMIEKIHWLLKKDIKVKIFTARASRDCAIPSVKKWIKRHIGVELEITNVKDLDCACILDDIAVAVDFNSGRHDDVCIWNSNKEIFQIL